jgi:phage repressor protein C with HTH and peptisase S24 domain
MRRKHAQPPLTHAGIWQAIDRLAEKHGMSASALARRAGLDSTTFIKSKRTSKEGKPRWPSTETVAKVLGATGETFAEFVVLASSAGCAPSRSEDSAMAHTE